MKYEAKMFDPKRTKCFTKRFNTKKQMDYWLKNYSHAYQVLKIVKFRGDDLLTIK
jgi:hypothetical protein